MRWVLLLLVGCGRIGFDPSAGASTDASGDASADAFDDSNCVWGSPVALDDVNTGDSESEPVLSPDGRILVFASNRMGGVARLFQSTRVGSAWSAASLIASLDSGAVDHGPSWNASGTRLYFSSFRGGPLRFYEAEFDGTSFGSVQLVAGLEALTESLAPTVRGDELEMFFSSRLAPSHIEYARRSSTSRSWQSLGSVPELVDAIDHGYPGVSADGLALYFEVERPGGFFIGRSRRPALEEPFGAVELVAELDAAGSHGDPQPSFDGTELVFASDRGQPGNFDLYLSARVCDE